MYKCKKYIIFMQHCTYVYPIKNIKIQKHWLLQGKI